MNTRLLATGVLLAALLVPITALGQSAAAGQVLGVQYSVPFGVVSGKLMLLGNYLVFLDEGQPESSFVVMRSQIAALTVDGHVVNVDTTGPIRDRDGDRTQFSFRLNEGADSGLVVTWRARGGEIATQVATGMVGDAERVYTAKHDHRIGSCRGQLIIRDGIIAYDSLSDIDHSRRWELIDIKELKQKNPYQLTLEGFRGGTYNLELQGRGMDPAEFKILVDRITTARTGG